jgi:hypothetical protein
MKKLFSSMARLFFFLVQGVQLLKESRKEEIKKDIDKP